MDRPDLIAKAGDKINRIERAQIRAIRRTLEPGAIDQTMRFCQRNIGARWIQLCTQNLTEFHHADRLPVLDPSKSFVCVSNHRSFFDLYVITSYMVARGMPHRIVFPVRANFFYDNPLGFAVNGLMSFFAMYPPIYRERKRVPLNIASLDEMVFMLKRGGAFVGIHPEGTRKTDDDPYTFLPAQSGIGRIIHRAGVQVIPVFINGLINDLKQQVKSNFDGTGRRINVVFGEPLDFGELIKQKPSPRAYKAIAERSMEVIGALGQEEKAIRASQ